MAKIYSEKQKSLTKMNPKKETVSFLLNFSKSMRIIKTKIGKFEIIAS